MAQFSDQYLSFDSGTWDHNQLQWSDLNDFPIGRASRPFELDGETLLENDFEDGERGLHFYSSCSAHIIKGDGALMGGGSLMIKASRDEWQPLFSMDLDPFSGRQSILISYRYHVVQAPENGAQLYQCFRAHGGDGSERAGGRARRVFTGESGYYLAECDKQLQDIDNYYFYMAVEGACQIVLDEIRIVRRASAYVHRTFSGGMLLHSLSKQGIELDPGPRWKATEDPRFAGGFIELDRGGWILHSGETLVLIDQGPDYDVDGDGSGEDADDEEDPKPDGETSAPVEQGTSFGAAYPNPFNPRVTIPFSLAEAGPVRVTIYDIQGRRVKELASEVFSAGNHQLEWTGLGESGRLVSSGVYFVRLESRDARSTQKLILAG